jgi:hypothetical protein
MERATKRFMREFRITMSAYLITIFGTRFLMNNMEPSPWRIAINLLPIIPVVFFIVAFMRYLTAIDELQQKIQLHAIGFAAGTTGLLTLAYGFLELDGLPHFPTFFIFPLIIILWGIGLSYFSRRYQ